MFSLSMDYRCFSFCALYREMLFRTSNFLGTLATVLYMLIGIPDDLSSAPSACDLT